MVKKGTVLIFLCNLALIRAQLQCCSGENFILIISSNLTCADGNEVKQLKTATKTACSRQQILSPSEVKVDEKGYLVYNEDYNEDTFSMSPEEYCSTKILEPNGTDVFVACYEEEDESISYEPTSFMMVNVILSFISVFFIVLTITVYLSAPELLDLQGICFVWVISGLASSFITLGIVNLSEGLPDTECKLLAYLIYLSFMSAFFWLNVLCFHIWKIIVNPKILRSIKCWLLIYHIVGIGGPLILLLFLLSANYSDYFHHDMHPGIGEGKCWFKSQSVTLIYFYGPISVLLCINIIYFVWTTKVLWSQMKNCSERKIKVLKYRLFLCVKLFFVMGLPWCFEVISAILNESTSKWIWVLPDAFNALQGLIIFLLLVVFRKKVLRALANKKIFGSLRFPVSWRHAQDDECDECDEPEEEINLSGVEDRKLDISN